jgi:hypothetical protein
MSKYPMFLVIAETPRVLGKVVPLRSARVKASAPALAAAASSASRETSWRDLVRRLARNLAKR